MKKIGRSRFTEYSVIFQNVEKTITEKTRISTSLVRLFGNNGLDLIGFKDQETQTQRGFTLDPVIYRCGMWQFVWLSGLITGPFPLSLLIACFDFSPHCLRQSMRTNTHNLLFSTHTRNAEGICYCKYTCMHILNIHIFLKYFIKLHLFHSCIIEYENLQAACTHFKLLQNLRQIP